MTVALKSVLLLLGIFASTANCRDFLGVKRLINTTSVREELDGILGEVLGHGHGVVNARLVKIQSALQPMFKSLPKNEKGHISASDMRYSVQRYFGQNHGWKVKGFDVHEQWNASSASDRDTFQSKLPEYVESILEERLAQQGFSLPAVVAIAASVERLAFDDLVRSIELAFHLNSLDVTKGLSDVDMTEILSSFLFIEFRGEMQDKEQHMKEKKLMVQNYPNWQTTVLFLRDTVSSEIFQRQPSSNPFVDQAYSFEDAVSMAERFSDDFGTWSNHECKDMKEELLRMDKQGTGRVKLSDFHKGFEDGAWHFSEDIDQLRQAGVLDESTAWGEAQVMIPNYINSDSNCLIFKPFYSICCLNECDHVFQQLETQVAASHAGAKKVIKALEGWPLLANITTMHRERLDRIAHVNDGTIPIYGRHFAGWLHSVFPQECPWPQQHPVTSGGAKHQQWQRLASLSQESATNDEIAQFLESGLASLGASPGKAATTRNFLGARSGGALLI